MTKLEFSALASGSSGNCFYVGDDKSAILIDAGISSKQIVQRLAMIGKSPENIAGIFITHEHIDHIRGVDVFARQFGIPIFANRKTAQQGFLCSDEKLIKHIKNNETVHIGGLKVHSFSKSHNAVDPLGFRVENEKSISIITDAGYFCKNIIEQIQISDALCIEANHDLEMLNEGPYPYYLKKLIGSDLGHLSNMQAGLGVLEHAPGKLKTVVLAHLSKTNNTPEIAYNTFNSLMQERKNAPRVFVSERDKPMDLIKI